MKLTDEQRDLLAKASVVAEAPAMRIDPNKTHHAKPGAIEPRWTGKSLHEEMADAFMAASNEGERARAIMWARSELARVGRTPPPPAELLEKGTLAWKRHIAGRVDQAATAKEVGEIARVNGCSRATAYRYAAMFGEREAA